MSTSKRRWNWKRTKAFIWGLRTAIQFAQIPEYPEKCPTCAGKAWSFYEKEGSGNHTIQVKRKNPANLVPTGWATSDYYLIDYFIGALKRNYPCYVLINFIVLIWSKCQLLCWNFMSNCLENNAASVQFKSSWVRKWSLKLEALMFRNFIQFHTYNVANNYIS